MTRGLLVEPRCLDGRRAPLGGPRFALGPLEAVLGCPPPHVLAARLGVSTRAILRWRLNGVDEYLADRLAIVCGFHPAVVWGRSWWADAEDAAA